MKNVIKHSRISISFAFYTTIAISLFFFLMKGLGLAENTHLRILNLVFLFLGTYFGLRSYKHTRRADFSYINGFFMGVKIGVLTAVMLSSAIIFYHLVAPGFINEILVSGKIANEHSLSSLIGIIVIETVSSSILCSFASMQDLRINTHSFNNI